MGRGRIVNALSFFVFLKNVFLNRHSCYYRIDNLNLRFAFLKACNFCYHKGSRFTESPMDR